MPFNALPEPMLARVDSTLPGDYAYEVKWDGFRTVISTELSCAQSLRSASKEEELLTRAAQLSGCAALSTGTFYQRSRKTERALRG
jgi:ATP-dependent DNA ligase